MYEVGQEVRITKEARDYEWAKHMTVFEGKVTGVNVHSHNCCKVDFDDREFHNSYLEPIGPKFKEGDEVRVIGDEHHGVSNNGKKTPLNTTARINEVFEKSNTYPCRDGYTLVGWDAVIPEQDLELVEEKPSLKNGKTVSQTTVILNKIEKEDVMATCEGKSREERAQDNDKGVKRINEQIKCLKEEVKTLNAESKNLRAYETDRDETIAQIKLAKKCKQDEAEAILALKDKGITV
jgi:hypothetical protein